MVKYCLTLQQELRFALNCALKGVQTGINRGAACVAGPSSGLMDTIPPFMGGDTMSLP